MRCIWKALRSINRFSDGNRIEESGTEEKQAEKQPEEMLIEQYSIEEIHTADVETVITEMTGVNWQK